MNWCPYITVCTSRSLWLWTPCGPSSVESLRWCWPHDFRITQNVHFSWRLIKGIMKGHIVASIQFRLFYSQSFIVARIFYHRMTYSRDWWWLYQKQLLLLLCALSTLPMRTTIFVSYSFDWPNRFTSSWLNRVSFAWFKWLLLHCLCSVRRYINSIHMLSTILSIYAPSPQYFAINQSINHTTHNVLTLSIHYP